MGIVAVFSVPADEFVLGHALQAAPSMTVDLERFVPTSQELLPFFWAWDHDFEAFEAAAEQELAIERLTAIEREENVVLYKAEWTNHLSNFLRIVVESEAAIVEAKGTAEEWSFTFRFPDQQALQQFQTACSDHGIHISLQRLQRLTIMDDNEPGEYGLTEKQRETLLLAFQEGYFDDPRQASLEELSGTFNVSSRAVSQRLRRAISNLVAHTLATRE